MIYIAYKYTNSPDKQALREDLETIANSLETKGHQTFVLFRDKKQWGMKHHNNKLHSMLFMIYKLIFASHVLVFVDNDSVSPGLRFELKYAKFLRKPITLLIQKGLEETKIRSKADFIVEFNSKAELGNLVVKSSNLSLI